MAGAMHWNDLRVGKKLRALAAHGFHKIAFRAVDKKNRTLEPPNESFNLSFRHRGGGAVAQDRIVFPAVSSSFERRPVARHVKRRLIRYQRKRLL